MSKYFAEENQPNNSKPACLKPPCQTKKIRAKFYIDDILWDEMQEKDDLDMEKEVNCRLSSKAETKIIYVFFTEILNLYNFH